MNDLLKAEAVRDRAYLAASAALRQAKERHGSAAVHRSLGSVSVRPLQVVQTLLLPIVFCALLLWSQPYLLAFWRSCILFWAARLAMPLRIDATAASGGSMDFFWDAVNSHGDMPGQEIWLVTAVLTIVVFVLSRRLDREKLPLKYLVRILCFIQMMSLIFFLVAPSLFPYSVADHIGDIVQVGTTLMYVAPIMLALGYYLLQVNLAVKILHTVLILAYFAVMIPHQVVLHALILHHFSSLFMPMLYICFGAVFDVLIFIALYSWTASTLPVRATR